MSTKLPSGPAAQVMLAAVGQIGLGEINDHAGRGRILSVHSDANVFHTVPANADAALRRGHHGVGESRRRCVPENRVSSLWAPMHPSPGTDPAVRPGCWRLRASAAQRSPSPPCPSCQPRPRSLSLRTPAAEPRCPAVAFAFPLSPHARPFSPPCVSSKSFFKFVAAKICFPTATLPES